MSFVRDLVALTKPRITFVVLITAAGGIKLAPGHLSGLVWLYTMVGTALIVGSANTLNMYWERDVDGKMDRTKNRPLPTGRLAPNVALWFGIALAVVSLPMLICGVNAMTGLLGAVALVSYVLLYTPMKRHSVRALWVGAVPGAIPPLLGWTAVTGRLDAAGIALFSILFLWQIPHFLAISVFRADDYTRAGLKVVPAEKGEPATTRMMVVYAVALVVASIWPVHENIAGVGYLIVALALGIAFIIGCALGFRVPTRTQPRMRWARSVFAFSIFYLVLLFGTLVLLGGDAFRDPRRGTEQLSPPGGSLLVPRSGPPAVGTA